MPERIRFHLDENVNPVVARALRTKGIAVSTAFEAGLQGEGDEAQWAFACREGRVLVTSDADFLRLAGRTSSCPGVVYFRMETRSVGEIIRGLEMICEVLDAEEMRDHVEYL